MRTACALVLLIFMLVLSFTATIPLPAHAQETPPTATPTATPEPEGNPPAGAPGPFSGFLPDPKAWASDVFNQVLVSLLQGISDAIRGVVDGVMGSSLNFITQTPPAGTYDSPTVKTLWEAVRTVMNAGLAIVALWGGFNLIVREQIGAPYHEAMELVPRLVIGALLANTSLSWAQLAIDVNNALCQGIGEVALPAWERVDSTTQLLVDVIAILIYLVTGLMLLLQMLMRLALIDVLLVAAPLGLLCWVLPQTQGWARLWSGTFFGVVFTQFVQVLALKLGGSLLTELAPMSPDAALLSVFLGVAVLALTLKIPSLMRNHVGDGLGFVRYYVYRQGARALEGEGGRSTGGS
ncbi:MAG: hypothetical protein IT305_19335 [Chloroflexi bacterium]|nr:hypothetical protein [Chloroflexota bacterium]